MPDLPLPGRYQLHIETERGLLLGYDPLTPLERRDAPDGRIANANANANANSNANANAQRHRHAGDPAPQSPRQSQAQRDDEPVLLPTPDELMMAAAPADDDDTDHAARGTGQLSLAPLDEQDRQTLLAKLRWELERSFYDRAWLVQTHGHAAQAVLIVLFRRDRPFVSAVRPHQPGQVVLRINRMSYHDPDQHTWHPMPRPMITLYRKVMPRRDADALCIGLWAKLGGLALSNQEPALKLGRIDMPSWTPGIAAVDDQGRAQPVQPLSSTPTP